MFGRTDTTLKLAIDNGKLQEKLRSSENEVHDLKIKLDAELDANDRMEEEVHHHKLIASKERTAHSEMRGNRNIATLLFLLALIGLLFAGCQWHGTNSKWQMDKQVLNHVSEFCEPKTTMTPGGIATEGAQKQMPTEEPIVSVTTTPRPPSPREEALEDAHWTLCNEYRLRNSAW